MNDANQIKLQLTMERISGAIRSGEELNPTNRLENPCSICNKNCLDNQACINCDTCQKWCHVKCDGTSIESYNYYKETSVDPSIKWHCLFCTMKFHQRNFAFTLSDTSELENINNSDRIKIIEYLG